jgi:ATP-dependent exoDNAse (exonuclease V) beta subunit
MKIQITEYSYLYHSFNSTMHQPQFLIYRSSAGSGKTQTLAGEYLKLVLSGRADFRHVLAITFTNKAAEEMKERVLQLLSLFASGTDLPDYHQDLLKEIAAMAGVSVDAIRTKAGEVRRELLHHYSEFNIGTIDSFVHRIIRSFALELNLSYAFEVQIDTSLFIQTAIDDLLDKTGNDPELTSNLVGFTRSLLEDEKSWNIDQALVGFAKFLTGEASIPPLEKLANAGIDFRQVAASNKKSMALITRNWDLRLKELDEKILNCGIGHDHFSNGLSGGIYNFFGKVLDNLDYAKVYNRNEDAKRVTGYLEERKPFYPKKTDKAIAGVLDALAEDLITIWNDLTADIDLHYPEYVTRSLVAENLTNLSLSKKIREQMQITMDRENLIPIYEFNRLIWSIIRNQPVPFIYERTSERFDHFLIDEFQDTSSLQWLNLLPLIDNALAQGGLSMVVGDAKQAIYRWRNGDVWQFVRLPEIANPDQNALLESRAASLKRYAQPHNLQKNFRSSPEIIAFNNEFFGWFREKYHGVLGDIYRDFKQIPGKKGNPGYVEIHMIPAEDVFRQDDYSRMMAEKVLEKVQGVLDHPGHGYNPADICILVRRNAEASIIATRLIEADIDVVSDDSLTLGSFPEPVTVKALAGLLLDRNSALHGAALLAQLYRGQWISHDLLHQYLTGIFSGEGSLWENVNLWLERAGIKRVMADYLTMPLYEFCEHVVRDFYGDKASGPAVQHLMDVTASFIQVNGNDLGKYMLFLDEQLDATIPLPETGRAVRIMTIHKAKGLQFPVVIYAFAMETTYHPGNRSRLLWVDEHDMNGFEGLPVLLLPFRSALENTVYAEVYEHEKNALLQDLANVVYVALTRPALRLYIVSAPHNRKVKSEVYLYDLFSEYLSQSALFKSEDQVVYKYGITAIPLTTPAVQVDPSSLRLPPWRSYPWQGRLGIRSGRLPLSDDSPRQQAITRGTLFHSLLAAICDTSAIDSTLDDFVRQGLVSPDDRDQWFQEIKELINSEYISPFFSKDVHYRNEATIITPDGRQLRPDKVVKLVDHIAVLDFKTGLPKREHQKQVNTYCDLLRAMGHEKVKGYLLYVDSKELTEI